MDAGEECDCGSPKVGNLGILQMLPGLPLLERGSVWWRMRFPDAHCTSALRNVKVTLAASQALAGSDPVLCVLMVTAVKTAR